MAAKMPPNGTMKLAELTARAEPTADNGGKHTAKVHNDRHRGIAPRSKQQTEMLAELTARAEPTADNGGNHTAKVHNDRQRGIAG